MMFSITVNGRKMQAEKGETILSALNRNGIKIPTLCGMKEFTPTGACRLCVVEVEGRERLITACSHPVEEWMNIHTHSPRVLKARKTIIELLLARHPDECLYCVSNLNCELQKLAQELNILERRIRGRKTKIRLDQSGHSVVRELSKCILCSRCVRVCEEIITVTALDFVKRGQKTHIGTSMDRDFNFTSCINCGQCINVCPTGALHEKQHIAEVQEYLSNKAYQKVVQYTPSVPSTILQMLGIKPSRDPESILNGILRKMGFDKIFLTGFGTDILVEELSDRLEKKIRNGDNGSLFISACPAWVKYYEQSVKDLPGELSTLKSPQQIMGAIIKSHYAPAAGLKPQEVYSVSVTPCTAMKFEAARESMTTRGICDVDAVLTVREMAQMIKLYGIDAVETEGEQADEPASLKSSAAVIAEVSGGLAEAVMRCTSLKISGNDPGRKPFKSLRGTASFREVETEIRGRKIRVGVVDGLAGFAKFRELIASGKQYDLVEVMVCPGGCVNGGGMPAPASKEEIRNRARLVYQNEESDPVQMPSSSPPIFNFYRNEVKQNVKTPADKLLHTSFVARDVLL
ncbi:MAG: 2Fe-2S iron-sulfur cluster binding domain-containing protein [Bacteroidales bacterium]|nr:2Fe-2S iron-sulfur cluster binding domain-containing protein [Bacteroidales bacterium]